MATVSICWSVREASNQRRALGDSSAPAASRDLPMLLSPGQWGPRTPKQLTASQLSVKDLPTLPEASRGPEEVMPTAEAEWRGKSQSSSCPLEKLYCPLAGRLTFSLWTLHSPGCQQVRVGCQAAWCGSCLSAQTQEAAPPKLPEEASLTQSTYCSGFCVWGPRVTCSPPPFTCLRPRSQSQPTSLARGQTTGETWERQEVPEVGQGWGESIPSPPGFPGLGLQEGPGLGKGKGARPRPPFRRQIGQNCSLGTLGRSHPASRGALWRGQQGAARAPPSGGIWAWSGQAGLGAASSHSTGVEGRPGPRPGLHLCSRPGRRFSRGLHTVCLHLS